MGFRRPYPGWPRRPRRPVFRPGGEKPRVFWAPSAWDATTGQVLAGNTAYNTELLFSAAAGATTTVGQAALEDYSLKRLFGFYRRCLATVGSNNQQAVWHAGLCVMDITAGGVLDSAQWAIQDDTITRRWLWQVHQPFGYVGNGAGASLQTPLSSDSMGPAFSYLDVAPKGVRIRPDQRLVLTEYVAVSGAADATFNSNKQLKGLVAMTVGSPRR